METAGLISALVLLVLRAGRVAATATVTNTTERIAYVLALAWSGCAIIAVAVVIL